jgi:hypothetical protein
MNAFRKPFEKKIETFLDGKVKCTKRQKALWAHLGMNHSLVLCFLSNRIIESIR